MKEEVWKPWKKWGYCLISADFLASENVPRLDGIIFPSVQTDGNSLNLVLFHKASIVENIQIAEGTEIDVHLGYEDSDGWTLDYSVHEQYPPKKKQQNPKSILPTIYSGGNHMDDFSPTPEPSLKVDLESIRVHKVSSIKFTTSDYPVRRHKYEKRKQDF